MSLTDPDYYDNQTVEPIDIFDECMHDRRTHFGRPEGLRYMIDPIEAAYLLNVLRYFMRYPKKHTTYEQRTDDLQKAVWYINRLKFDYWHADKSLTYQDVYDCADLDQVDYGKRDYYANAMITSNHLSQRESKMVKSFMEYWLSYIKQDSREQRVVILYFFEHDLTQLIEYLDKLDKADFECIREIKPTESKLTNELYKPIMPKVFNEFAVLIGLGQNTKETKDRALVELSDMYTSEITTYTELMDYMKNQDDPMRFYAKCVYAVINGYIVEPEKLYYVEVNNTGLFFAKNNCYYGTDLSVVKCDRDVIRGFKHQGKYRFTESEITEYNLENYYKFEV